MKKYLYIDLYEQEEKHWWHLAKRKLVGGFIEKYLNKKPAAILDIGCGTGKNIEVLSKFGEVWGVDISKKAIHFCRQRGIKNVKVAGSENTNMKSESFDLVTLLDVLEHTDDGRSLRETSRILKKNGLLIITVPAFQWLWGEWDRVLHHKRRYNRNNLGNLLNANGYRILKISYAFSFLVLPVLITRYVRSRIFARNYPSDFKIKFFFADFVFKTLSNVENSLIKRVDIPFGTSLVCVAKKN